VCEPVVDDGPNLRSRLLAAGLSRWRDPLPCDCVEPGLRLICSVLFITVALIGMCCCLGLGLGLGLGLHRLLVGGRRGER